MSDYEVATDELLQIVEQLEGCDAEKKDIAERRKEILNEAGARGYDKKALNALVKIRAQDPDQRSEEESILDVYKTALNIE